MARGSHPDFGLQRLHAIAAGDPHGVGLVAAVAVPVWVCRHPVEAVGALAPREAEVQQVVVDHRQKVASAGTDGSVSVREETGPLQQRSRVRAAYMHLHVANPD